MRLNSIVILALNLKIRVVNSLHRLRCKLRTGNIRGRIVYLGPTFKVSEVIDITERFSYKYTNKRPDSEAVARAVKAMNDTLQGNE